MIKKKKVVRFRELFDVIDEWLKSYNFDNTAELLRSEHDLDLTTGTLKSYVHRHRKHLAKQSVIKDEIVQHSENTEKSDEINISLLKTKEVKRNVDSESDNQDDEELDFDALLKEFKNKHHTDQTKSLLDK